MPVWSKHTFPRYSDMLHCIQLANVILKNETPTPFATQCCDLIQGLFDPFDILEYSEWVINTVEAVNRILVDDSSPHALVLCAVAFIRLVVQKIAQLLVSRQESMPLLPPCFAKSLWLVRYYQRHAARTTIFNAGVRFPYHSFIEDLSLKRNLPALISKTN